MVTNNIASNGGFILFQNSNEQEQNTIVFNNTFKYNKALQNGGVFGFIYESYVSVKKLKKGNKSI